MFDGVVEVSNQGGTVILDENSKGTLIFGTNVGPEEPTIWLDDRCPRALMTVAF